MTEKNKEIQKWGDSVAELAADALIDAKLIKTENFEEAVSVISLEIFVTLICGDYPPPCKPKQLR